MRCLVKGIPIHYQEYGEGTPLLMFHGWPADHRHMVDTFEPVFAESIGWKRVYMDFPGMGETPSAEWITNQDDMLAITMEFCDTLYPETRFAVAGVSYGCLIAQGMVHIRPDRLLGAAMVAPALELKNKDKQRPTPTFIVRDEALITTLPENTSGALDAFATVHTSEMLDWLERCIFPAMAVAHHQFLAKIRSDFEFTFNVNDLQKPFEKPMLFICGKQDSLWGYSDGWVLLSNFPRASYVVLDRAGHAVAFEQNEVVVSLMRDWLNRLNEFQRDS